MKSYTDLPQSKKLAEILPIESADMKILSFGIDIKRRVVPIDDIAVLNKEDEIPCWSLAALLNVLPKYELYNFGNTIQLDVNKEALATEDDETLLDLVVNMIIHLHEQKLL